MNAGTIILLGGVGVAAFLWYRSQQAQAAALAAAQAAPGAGLTTKIGNSVKAAAKGIPGAVKGAFSAPVGLAKNVGGTVKNVGTTIVHGITGIL